MKNTQASFSFFVSRLEGLLTMHKKMENKKYSEHCNASFLQTLIDSSSKLLFSLSLPRASASRCNLNPAASAGAGSLFPVLVHPLTGLLRCYRLSWRPAS